MSPSLPVSVNQLDYSRAPKRHIKYMSSEFSKSQCGRAKALSQSFKILIECKGNQFLPDLSKRYQTSLGSDLLEAPANLATGGNSVIEGCPLLSISYFP